MINSQYSTSDTQIYPGTSSKLAVIWYVVSEHEYDIAKCSILTHLTYEWVGAIVVVYSGIREPIQMGELSEKDCRVFEYWQCFGDGYGIPPNVGGFDQIKARTYAISLAANHNCLWMIHCDADEFFLNDLGELLISSNADIIKTSVYHLLSPNTFWVQTKQVKYVDEGEILFSPRLRIWRTKFEPKILYDQRNSNVNVTRHCITSFTHISSIRTEYLPGLYHIHIHFLLYKSQWDIPKPEGILSKSPLPLIYCNFLNKNANPNYHINEVNLELITDVFEIDLGEDKWIIYAPLKGTAFYTDTLGANMISALRKGQFVKHSDCSMPIIEQLTVIGALGRKKESGPKISLITEFKPVEATLLFNESCNMGCSYCYASSKPSIGEMTWELAEASLRFVVDNAADTLEKTASIRYLGGGEPTLSWDLIERSTKFVRNYANQKGVSVWIRLITNGTVLNSVRSQWLFDNVDYVTLSFEILPELQGDLRPLVGGQNSYDRVIKSLKELKEVGVPFEIRSTVSEKNASRMLEAVEFCNEIGGISEIRFEPVSSIGKASFEAGVSSAQKAFVSEFLNARFRGNELGINVRCKMTRNIDRIGARFCEAEFAVSYTGIVSACHRYSRKDIDGFETFHIGQYSNGHFNFNLDQINVIRGISVNTFEECKTCFAKWNCAGECLSKRVSGTTINTKGSHCDIVRGVLAHMIQERLNGEEVLAPII